jgi:hypothetical protein
MLRAASAAWRDGAPAAERPATAVSALYAGQVDGARVVLLQGLDAAGRPRVAEVAGPLADRALRLVRAEPLATGVPLLALATAGAFGPAGSPQPGLSSPSGGEAAAVVRLLGPPDETREGWIYLREGRGAPGAPLRRLGPDSTGLTAPLRLTGGVDALVQSGPVGDLPAGVAGSGTVSPGRLTATPGLVEVVSPTIPAGPVGEPTHGWFADGRLLSDLLERRVTVAAVGAAVSWAPATGMARGREFRSQAYEVTSGGQRWLSVVFRLDDRPLCIDVTPLGDGPARVPLAVRRCVAPRTGAGVVHVVAGPGSMAVRLVLVGAGPGQRAYRGSVRPPKPSSTGFTAAALIPAGYPLGPGRAEALNAGGRRVSRALLGAYRL